jgi:hypothetical protein
MEGVLSSGRPGALRAGVCLPATGRRCRDGGVAGVAGNTSARRARGAGADGAANRARSAGSYRTPAIWRRSTAFSCRGAGTSAVKAPLPRAAAPGIPGTLRLSRYAVPIDTAQANQWRNRRAKPPATPKSCFRAAQCRDGSREGSRSDEQSTALSS